MYLNKKIELKLSMINIGWRLTKIFFLKKFGNNLTKLTTYTKLIVAPIQRCETTPN